MHDALDIALDVPQGNAELAAVVAQGADLRLGVVGPQWDVARRNRVVHRGKGLFGPADPQAPAAKFREGLRRCHFVNQVGIDVDYRRFPCLG